MKTVLKITGLIYVGLIIILLFVAVHKLNSTHADRQEVVTFVKGLAGPQDGVKVAQAEIPQELLAQLEQYRSSL